MNRRTGWGTVNMSVATVLKIVAWGVIVAVAIQVIFYFVFQMVGYDSFILSMTLAASLIIGYSLLIGWEVLKAIDGD